MDLVVMPKDEFVQMLSEMEDRIVDKLSGKTTDELLTREQAMALLKIAPKSYETFRKRLKEMNLTMTNNLISKKLLLSKI